MDATPGDIYQRFSEALLHPLVPLPEGLLAGSRERAVHRFAVHRNNVLVSLVDALATTYPVVHELVGDEFFRACAAVHVRQCPPDSPVLALYGKEFGDFLDWFPPAQSVPYLGDVARLEYARVVACHAADSPVLQEFESSLARGNAEAMQGLRFRFHPSARLVRSRFAVASIWAAHNGEGDLAVIDIDQPEASLVTRVGEDVHVLVVSEAAATFIGYAKAGATFGAAAAAALQRDETHDLVATLSTLARQHALTGIELAQRETKR